MALLTTMPRPLPDLERFRPGIEHLLKVENRPHTAVRAWLLNEKGVSITPRTFNRQLNRWALTTRPRRKTQNEEALRARIEELFKRQDLDDDKTLRVLILDGYKLSIRQYKDLRKKMGLRRKQGKKAIVGISDGDELPAVSNVQPAAPSDAVIHQPHLNQVDPAIMFDDVQASNVQSISIPSQSIPSQCPQCGHCYLVPR